MNSNFDNKSNKILDILAVNDGLVISYSKKISDNCFTFNIAKAKFNKKFLNFRNFFESQECNPESFFAGKLHEYFHENEKGLLVTIDMWGVTETKESIRNSGYSLPQDQNSLFGKILFLNYKGEYKVFSKGHRTPQGLFVTNENFILSTEHGPRGGDEINLIEYKGNYGWPVASYGELYKNQEPLNKLYYKKSHEQYGFIEPIFSFSQSIGISQLTEVPKNFSKYWNNNFLITSLNSASLYRVKFDNNFTKLLYYEKIFVGKRIRDIIYIESLKTFIISLDEGSGFLGFVSLDE